MSFNSINFAIFLLIVFTLLDVTELFKKFSKKYDIPFYDYSTDTLCFHKKYFYNALHLNKTGAEIFTNKLIAL